MNGFAQLLVVIGAIQLCDKHVGAGREADECTGDQVGHGTGGTDGGQRLIGNVTGKLADDDEVSRIEQKLQNAGENQRQ